MQAKVNFFKSLPWLNHWTTSQVEKLVYLFGEKKITRNQTLIQQGEDANYIYIVKSGEFEMTRAINRHVSKGNDPYQQSKSNIN